MQNEVDELVRDGARQTAERDARKFDGGEEAKRIARMNTSDEWYHHREIAAWGENPRVKALPVHGTSREISEDGFDDHDTHHAQVRQNRDEGNTRRSKQPSSYGANPLDKEIPLVTVDSLKPGDYGEHMFSTIRAPANQSYGNTHPPPQSSYQFTSAQSNAADTDSTDSDARRQAVLDSERDRLRRKKCKPQPDGRLIQHQNAEETIQQNPPAHQQHCTHTQSETQHDYSESSNYAIDQEWLTSANATQLYPGLQSHLKALGIQEERNPRQYNNDLESISRPHWIGGYLYDGGVVDQTSAWQEISASGGSQGDWHHPY